MASDSDALTIEPSRYFNSTAPGASARTSGTSQVPEAEVPVPLRTWSYNDDQALEGPWRQKTVISFDGGGIRGYSSLLILRALMVEIRAAEIRLSDGLTTASSDYPWMSPKSQQRTAVEDQGDVNENLDDFLPCHYFDYMAGTSTGGKRLSAIMLGRMRLSVDNALKQYLEFGNEVFGKPRLWHERSWAWYPRAKYATRRVRGAFQQMIYRNLPGDHEPMTETRAKTEPFKYRGDRTRTLVFSFRFNRSGGIDHACMWRTYDKPRADHTQQPNDRPDFSPRPTERVDTFAPESSPTNSTPIWQVARATSAAPRFFECIKMPDGNKHVDGGLAVNNPSGATLREVIRLHGYPPSLFISLGTGKKGSSDINGGSVPREPDFRLRERNIDDVRRKQALMKYLELGKHWKDYAVDTEGPNNDWLIDTRTQNVDRCRFNVEGELWKVPLDDWRPKVSGHVTLKMIQAETDKYLAKRWVRQNLADMAGKLVEIRRRRALTERWEYFAVDTAYRCPKDGCGALEPPTREGLRSHVLNSDPHKGEQKGLTEREKEAYLSTGRYVLAITSG